MKKRLKTGLFAALLMLAAWAMITPCHGRIFTRWRTRSESTQALESVGGQLAYETILQVNGSSCRLTAFGFAEPAPAIMARIRELFGTETVIHAGGTMGYAGTRSGRNSLHFMVLEYGDPYPTMVIKMEQEPDPVAAPVRTIEAVPSYPQSQPGFFSKNEDTGTSLLVSKTDADPATVFQFYHSSLTRTGWQAVLPSTPARPGESVFSFYTRKGDLCGLFLETPDPSQTRITLLHKQRGMK